MKTQPYFQAIINAGSIEERDMRINELLIRGFTVHQLHDMATDFHGSRAARVNGYRHGYDGGSNQTTYRAVMRKVKC